jgi:hypothetical protein
LSEIVTLFALAASNPEFETSQVAVFLQFETKGIDFA